MSLQDLISHKVEPSILTESVLSQMPSTAQQGLSICYSADSLSEQNFQDILTITPPTEEQTHWIHWTRLDATPDIFALFEAYDFHALFAEDILNTSSRIKIEELADSIIIATKIPVLDETENEISLKHFCLVLNEKRVISFSEIPLPILSDIHRRLAAPNRRIRQRGADYLFWAILDVLADYNTLFADSISEKMDALESLLIDSSKALTLKTIHTERTLITQFHRMAHPCRDIAARLTRSDSELIEDDTVLFFKDLFDHTSQTVDTTEYLREQAANLTELYYTTNSHHMNEVMKVLTSISAIFLPLTFLVGIYGMNFQNMPELATPWAYPVFLCILFAIGIILALIFKKKQWL